MQNMPKCRILSSMSENMTSQINKNRFFYLKTLFQIEFPHFDMSTMKQYGEVVLDGEDFCKRHKVGTTEDRPERTFLRWAYKIFQGGTDISIKHKPWNVVNMSRFNVINLSFNYVSNLLIGMQFFLEFITVTLFWK